MGKDLVNSHPAILSCFFKNTSDACFIFQCFNTVVNYYRNVIKRKTPTQTQIDGEPDCSTLEATANVL